MRRLRCPDVYRRCWFALWIGTGFARGRGRLARSVTVREVVHACGFAGDVQMCLFGSGVISAPSRVSRACFYLPSSINVEEMCVFLPYVFLPLIVGRF